jgi:hypothetical protein
MWNKEGRGAILPFAFLKNETRVRLVRNLTLVAFCYVLLTPDDVD